MCSQNTAMYIYLYTGSLFYLSSVFVPTGLPITLLYPTQPTAHMCDGTVAANDRLYLWYEINTLCIFVLYRGLYISAARHHQLHLWSFYIYEPYMYKFMLVICQ
jgi:hypothetical protein